MSPPMVLLIETCDAQRYATRLALKSLGAEVCQAQSVVQALALAEARRPDLVICAPSLAGMNALDLLELLRMRSGTDAPPVVVHCHDDTWPLAAAALHRGALAVVDPAALRAGLAEWLRAATDDARARVPPTTDQALDQASERPPPHTDAARAAPAASQPQALISRCLGQTFAGGLLGLLLGLWIAAILAP
ncbi:two-component system response regulator [uncultured Thiohalocapsa sp.]|uniref:response regulator n=1 Tax=uncultured Thiohalocapsa sp. TaxID=768990 RepID=UPI0025ECCD00|nr:response regulator [uncultured Thiohalocapsa sp.]